MAAFAQINRSSSSSSPRRNDNTSVSSRRRTLPEGACNYRDLNASQQPPVCGCRRFWWTGAVLTTQETGYGQWSNPSCVCGHHACFHDLVERLVRGNAVTQQFSPNSMAPLRAHDVHTRAFSRPDGNTDGPTESPFMAHSVSRVQGENNSFQSSDMMSTPGRLGARHLQGIGLDIAIPDTYQGQRGENMRDLVARLESRPCGAYDFEDLQAPPLCPFTTSKNELRSNHEVQPNHNTNLEGYSVARNFRFARFSGSGFAFRDMNRDRGGNPASTSPTVADAASLNADHPSAESQMAVPSTRQGSTDASIRVSPNTDFVDRVLAARRFAPPLDLSEVVATELEDLVQSATEIATPSLDNTPDFQALDKLVQETRGLIDTISGESKPIPNNVNTSASATSNKQPAPEKTSSPNSQYASIQAALQKIPVTLQQVTPLLNSLHVYLSRHSDVSVHESIVSLTKRLDSMETSSFNHVNPEQLNDQFDTIDGRLIELEDRTNEHERFIAAFDPDHSHVGAMPRRLHATHERYSLDSNRSHVSATSSALISTAIHRVDPEHRLDGMEVRLEDLENAQLPCLSYPWEIEVVLLPWGRDLKGIWYPSEDLMKPGMTQESDPWTQSLTACSMSASVGVGNGWTQEAIRHWAGNTERWLSPKACRTNGLVYHRLLSRGLIKNVTLTKPGAMHVREMICSSFGNTLDTVFGDGQSKQPDRELKVIAGKGTLMGLDAPFIPLRKIHKSSRLRYLAPTELATPALWTAEFLSSGIFMRAAGGKKRLFVTSREAYLQQNSELTLASSWTWQGLRELPCVQSSDCSKSDKSDASHKQAREADAQELCWTQHPALDMPLTTHSSFAPNIGNSFVGAQKEPSVDHPQSVRGKHESPEQDPVSVDEQDIRRDIESQQSNDMPNQPITPLSEFRTQHRRNRTVSVPISGASSAPSYAQASDILKQHQDLPFQASKRRIQSFSHYSNPLIAALPTFIPSNSRSRSRFAKRRRLTRSRSGSPQEDEAYASSSQESAASLDSDIDPSIVLSHLRKRVPGGESIMPIWAFTPRRSKSPFFAEGSDAGAGASQSTTARSAVRGRSGQRGITPSAYATPFSGTTVPLDGDRSSDVDADSSEGDEVWKGVEDGCKATTGPAAEIESMDDEIYDYEDDGEFSESSHGNQSDYGNVDEDMSL